MGNAAGFKRFKPLPLALGISLGLSSIGYTEMTLGAPAPATITQQSYYDLPAASLQETLSRISSQSGLDIQVSVPNIGDYNAPAIKGNLNAGQAVAAAIAGTSLTSSTTPDGNLLISAPAPVAAAYAPSNGAMLPAISVEGAPITEEYAATASSSATRTNTALQETPQSIKTVTRQVIEDRQTTSVEDALRNAAGVVAQEGSLGTTTYYIRGYEVTQTATDGVSGPETRGGVLLPSAPIDGVESVEVIKGPAAVMSGSSSPGGTINIVRKAPVTTPLHVIRQEVTDRGEYKTAIDLGGALTDDKAWSYRLNYARLRSSETYPDYNGSRGDFFAPVIAWQGNSTRIKVGAEFNDSRSAQNLAGTFYNTRTGKIADLSTPRLGDQDDHISSITKTGYYELNQDLADGWTFNSKATYSDSHLNFQIYQPYAIAANGTMVVNPFTSVNNVRYWSTQNDFRGTFDTGPLKHEVLIGFDYMHSNNTQYDGITGRGPFIGGNAYDPDSQSYQPISTTDRKSYEGRSIQRGLLIQDQITIMDKLHLLFAGKEAQWQNETQVVGRAGSSFDQKKWVPNYGIAYDLTDEITVYANLLNGFSGSSNVDVSGTQLAPSESKAKELGVKFSLLDDRLTITSAVFDIEQTNVPVANQLGQYLGTEGRMSKGFDFDLNGQLLPGWDLTFSYTYSKFEDPAMVNGRVNRITGQPKQSANLWTSYQLQEGLLKGLGAGIGVTAQSSSWNGFRNSTYFKNPGRAQTDLSVFYRQKEWSLTLGVKNVFDRDIYAYSTSPLWINQKEGRTTRLTAEYRF
ncbi:TonB-dependent siderophore receptor [Pseudomonas sp. W5-01]|uniref:TonB-dependent siderophore receptor n=1 Tax=Pseudomonas sp. W5-01 TaxID=3097454 RepID=UPI00397A2DDC